MKISGGRWFLAYFFRSIGRSLKGDADQGAADFEKAAELDPKVVEHDGAATFDEVAPLIQAFAPKRDAEQPGRGP